MWETQRKDIADEIENLGNDYREQLRAGWVKYLETIDPEGVSKPVKPVRASGKKIVVGDDDA